MSRALLISVLFYTDRDLLKIQIFKAVDFSAGFQLISDNFGSDVELALFHLKPTS